MRFHYAGLWCPCLPRFFPQPEGVVVAHRRSMDHRYIEP